MNRRNALKIFGTLVVCLAGKSIIITDITRAGEKLDPPNILMGPMDYSFTEKGIRNIIIEKIDGKKLIIPFSEIVKALEI